MESVDQSALWFAVSVKPRFENAVSESLKVKGYEIFLPRKLGSSSALFPGYLFCRLDINVRAPIVTTVGVIRILGFGCRPAAIQPAEMANLMTAVRSGGSLRALPSLYEGDPVEVVSGPLSGCCGVLTRIDKHVNFVVSIWLLQRSIALAFRPEWLVRAHTPVRIAEAVYGY